MSEQNYQSWRDARIAQLLKQSSYDVNDLRDIVVILRGEGGCPWDREQDHHSIRKGLIEECYEVVEAIDRDDAVLLREELGDVLLQIVFHADMEKDAGRFDLDDVANDECIKMIHRHPHVFGTVQADTSEEVLENWDKIKTEEKKRISLSEQLRAIPPMLPALMRAQKVGKKSGADTQSSVSEVVAQITDTLMQLERASSEVCTQQQILGDALFRMTSLCRMMGVEAEEALTASVERVIKSAEEK